MTGTRDTRTVRIRDPDRLKSAIEAQGLTVREVADTCGVSRQLISRLINDPGRSGISTRTAECVSRVVRVDFDRLWLP